MMLDHYTCEGAAKSHSTFTGNLSWVHQHSNAVSYISSKSLSYLVGVVSMFIGLLCNAAVAMAANGLTILPASPMNFEQVIARISLSHCPIDQNTMRIRQAGNVISIDDVYDEPCVDIQQPTIPFDFRLGQFPPGTYYVIVYSSYDNTSTFTKFTVTDSYATKTGPFPIVDYTDHWWNPQESGWGLSIMQHPSDRIFAAWFVYDQSGQPTWYTLQPGQWVSSTVYTGPIYKTSGPYYGSTFDPNQVGVVLVGTGTFSFTDYTTGTFTYTVEGVTGSKAITRLPF